MKKSKRIIISVSNDLYTDQRVDRTCSVLTEMGYSVLLLGRKLSNSRDLSPRIYSYKRMRLLFNKGFLFYAELNLRIFFFLLLHNSDVFYSNDLDTLLGNFLASRIKNKPLVYDSHEYFTEMPELTNRFAKIFWEKLEAFLLPKLKYTITVCESIKEIYNKKYNVDFQVIRNVSKQFPQNKHIGRKELNLPQDKAIIILQGAGINKDRGVEELIEAMDYLREVFLIILGGGDQMEELKKMAKDKVQKNQILFLPRMEYQEMMAYTKVADLGLSLEKNTNLNMEYSLPNKLFEYIQAGIPVLSTALTQKKQLIQKYKIGELIEKTEPLLLAQKIKDMLFNENKRKQWEKNVATASKELVWKVEKKKLITFIKKMELSEFTFQTNT